MSLSIRKYNRRAIWIRVAIAVFILAGILTAKVFHRTSTHAPMARPSLLLLTARATHVIGIANIPYPDNANWEYRWITPHSFVVSYERFNYDPASGFKRTFSLYDIVSGQITPYTRFDNTPATEADEGPSALDLSPNGRCLVWQRYHSGTYFPPTTQGPDSSEYYQYLPYRGYWGCYPCWLADSRHWLKFGYEGKGDHKRIAVTVQDVQQLEKPRVLYWPALPLDDISLIGSDFDEDRACGITTTRQDHLIVDNWHGDRNTTHVRLQELKIGQKLTLLHQYTFPLPNGSVLARKISPLGDRIAWLFAYERTVPGTHSMQAIREVWTCNLNGTGWHRLGQLDTQEPTADPNLVRLQWLPDGKHLSLYTHQALYIVPID